MLTLAAVVFITFLLEIVVLLHVPFSTIFNCFQIAIRFSKVQGFVVVYSRGLRRQKRRTGWISENIYLLGDNCGLF